MSSGITGSYDGEGNNVLGGVGNPTPVAPSPDAWATGPNPTGSGQSKIVGVAMDRRRRLRTANEPYRQAEAINVASADQILTVYARGVYISSAGNIVGRLVDDTADQTFTGLLAGQTYPFSFVIIRKTNTTAAGLLLF